MRTVLVIALVVAAILEGPAHGGERWQTRVRTRVASTLTGLAQRIAPTPPAPEPVPALPPDPARRIAYKRFVETQLSPRGDPGAPDKRYTTVTEIWKERLVKGKRPLVPGTGFSSKGTDHRDDRAQEARTAIWRGVTRFRAYLEGSTMTVRKEALPILDQILAVVSTATEFYIHDSRPTMKTPTRDVSVSEDRETKRLKVSIGEPSSGQKPIADIELSTGAIEQGQGLLTLTDHLKNVTITELRYGDDRATVERKTTTSRKLTRPTLEQRRFDAAFQKD